jgi:HSP90 family molecular chaperone
MKNEAFELIKADIEKCATDMDISHASSSKETNYDSFWENFDEMAGNMLGTFHVTSVVGGFHDLAEGFRT